MDAVHIVAQYDIFYYIDKILLYGRIGRVEIKPAAVAEKPLRFAVIG